jgi:hypothetical protein
VKKPEPVKAEAPKPEPVKRAEKPEKTEVAKAEPAKKAEPVVASAKPAKGDKLLTRMLSLEKQASAKPDLVPAVDRTILGKYIDAIKNGSIKPEQRDQAEAFANKIDGELKGQ